MIALSVENFRGCRSADIKIDRIALVAGPNGAGKTSIALAAAAALTGETMPLKGLRKSDARDLVTDGGRRARVTVTTDGGIATLTYPAAKLAAKGEPTEASAYATGLRSVLDLDRKQAAKELADFLGADPTRDDLQRLYPDVDSDSLNHVYESINRHGWDAAYIDARERGAELKGRWRAVTGEAYGVEKAESWLPESWSAELEDADGATLRAAVKEASARLDDAIAAEALNDAERQRLSAHIEAADEAKAKGPELRKKRDALAEELERERAALAELPRPIDQSSQTPCPYCGGALAVHGRSVVAAQTLEPEENEARANAIAEQSAKVDRMARELSALDSELGELRRIVESAKKLRETLDNAKPPSNALDVETARAELANAEARLSAFLAKRDADELHEKIVSNQRIIDLLGPEGVRLAKLRETVGAFNKRLARLCEIAGWPAVEIRDDMTVTFNGRPAVLLAQSELWRCRVVLQVAMSELDDSGALVIDAADILDRVGRNGLFRLVLSAGLPALICMTANDPSDVPNLAERGIGHTYWLRDGQALELET